MGTTSLCGTVCTRARLINGCEDGRSVTCVQHLEGFDLRAAVIVAAQHAESRLSLEKLLRYCARPPIAQHRLSELPDHRIALQLKSPWSDGSTHVVFEGLDLIPRPNKNLVLYHGVDAIAERYVRARGRGRTVGSRARCQAR